MSLVSCSSSSPSFEVAKTTACKLFCATFCATLPGSETPLPDISDPCSPINTTLFMTLHVLIALHSDFCPLRPLTEAPCIHPAIAPRLSAWTDRLRSSPFTLRCQPTDTGPSRECRSHTHRRHDCKEGDSRVCSRVRPELVCHIWQGTEVLCYPDSAISDCWAASADNIIIWAVFDHVELQGTTY